MDSESELDEDFDAKPDCLAIRDSVVVYESKGKSLQSVKYLKEVAVPAKRSASIQTAAPSQRSSSVSSLLSSQHDLSMDYDTPSTSVVVTPADLSVKSRRSHLLSKGKISKVSNKPSQVEAEPQLKSTIRTRKRGFQAPANEDLLNSDACFAQRLQAEEYAESSVQQTKPTMKRKLRVEDSEDLGSLSELSSDDDLNCPTRSSSVESDLQKVKKIKTGGRLNLLSRAARDNARQSIADKVSLGVMDEDEDDNSLLSDYISDEDSAFESDMDDDLIGNILDQTDLNTAATVTGAPSTLSSRARRRRLAVTSTTNRNSSENPWTERVNEIEL